MRRGTVTEFGYTTESGIKSGHPEYASHALAIVRARPWIDGLFWYSSIDANESNGNWGLWTLNGWTVGTPYPMTAQLAAWYGGHT